MLNLSIPKHSYFYGFATADGNCYRKKNQEKGKFSIEISSRDKDILYKFQDLYSEYSSISHRTRNTDFKNSSKFSKISVYNLSFRNKLKSYGFMEGYKSDDANIPNMSFSEIDFIRGLLDGDGSVGFTSNNIPFVSLTTKSEKLKEFYLAFLNKYIGISKICNRNERDNIYNIMVMRDKAVELYILLYYNGCLCLSRKNITEIGLWKNPHGYKKVQHWSDYEINYILTNSLKESMLKLNRTEKSIRTKLARLRKIKSN